MATTIEAGPLRPPRQYEFCQCCGMDAPLLTESGYCADCAALPENYDEEEVYATFPEAEADGIRDHAIKLYLRYEARLYADNAEEPFTVEEESA